MNDAIGHLNISALYKVIISFLLFLINETSYIQGKKNLYNHLQKR